MKKVLLAGIVSGILFFCTVGGVGAALVTQPFYVEIDNVDISEGCPGCEFYENLSRADYYSRGGPAVGSKFFGSVTYDNSNIPTTGTYIISFANPYTDPLANEFQNWRIEWNGVWGFWDFDLLYYPHRLYFMDKKLSGIDSFSWPDTDLVRGEGFRGTDYIVYGLITDYEPRPNGPAIGYRYETHGNLNSVPEPSTMLLLAVGLIGITGYSRKNFKRS